MRTLRRVLITGGTGFIGSHLVDALVEKGVEVVVLDNLANGCPENLAKAVEEGQCHLIEADVTTYEALCGVCEGIDTVFHLAGLADIVPSVETPRKYLRVNAEGTINVLEAARLAGVGRVVYSASASCYGIPEKYPTPETAAINPQYPYALSKRIGEECLLHWASVYGLGVNSLRLFNVYGPRAQTRGVYGGVFKVFLPQKLAGKPFTIVGDGEQVRDFVHVTDVTQAFLAAARSDVCGEIFNVGSGAPQSINHLAALLGGERTHLPKRPGEPDITWADIRKITDMLGWRPKIAFEQGVAEILERIDDYQEATVWNPESIRNATRAWFANLGRREVE
jgi:UDP-glucose 4-epimerase